MIAVPAGAAALLAYVLAVRAFERRYPHRRFGGARVAAFTAGVAILTVAVTGPFDRLADGSFAAHMVQHLVLTLIGPPLLLLGAPLLLVVALPRPEAGRALARVVRHPIAHALVSPPITWLAFVATLWAVHFSALYDLALRVEAAHVFEHALLVTTALLFWMPVVQAGYAPRVLSFPARMLYVLLAIPPGAFLGLAIYSSRFVMYPHYLAGRSFASAIADQRAAGEIMWIAGGAVLFCAFMLTAAMWAVRERDEALA